MVYKHIFPIRTCPCGGLHPYVHFHSHLFHVLLVTNIIYIYIYVYIYNMRLQKQHCITDIPNLHVFFDFIFVQTLPSGKLTVYY